MSITQGPLSPGTMADDATVGTVAWSNPDNAKLSDNVYATAETPATGSITTHYLKATNFGFSIPAGATINGIVVEVEKKDSNNTITDSSVKIVKADGTIGTTNKADTVSTWNTADAYKTYGSSSDLWGETWSDTDINDVDFGFVISAFRYRFKEPLEVTTISVDHIRITVYYTPLHRFWVGGTGNWDASDTTHWAVTSGGAGGFPVPTSADDVTFDANSGVGAVIVTSGVRNCNNFDSTGASVSSISISGQLTVFANLTLGLNLPGIVGLVGLSDTTPIITSNGFSFSYLFLGLVNGVGTATYTLADDLVCTDSLYFSHSYNTGTVTFNANNFNVTARVFYSYQNSSSSIPTVVINMGSGTWTATGSNGWYMVSATNLTINASTSTIKLTDTSTSPVYFLGRGKTYNNVWFARGASTGLNQIYDSNTFAELKDTGTEAHSIQFQDGTDQNITSLNVNGSAGKLITLTGTSSAGWRISDTTGTNTVTYCNIAYSTAEGGATWNAIIDTNVNGGNNTGWYFHDPFTNPGNIYASDNTYATLPATSGILTVEVSKDAGVNWLVAKTVTFTASDTLQTCGTGSTELWGASFTRADMVDANFRVRLTHGGYMQVYKTFGFATGTDILTGIEVAIEGKYASPTMSLDLLEVKIHYGTSTLLVQAGSQAFDSTNSTLAVYNGASWDDLATTSALALKAPLASPTFTGTVTLPSGQALIAPALGTPASGVMTNVTGLPAAQLSGAIPSAVTATTQSANDNSTKLATTAYADTGISLKGFLGKGYVGYANNSATYTTTSTTSTYIDSTNLKIVYTVVKGGYVRITLDINCAYTNTGDIIFDIGIDGTTGSTSGAKVINFTNYSSPTPYNTLRKTMTFYFTGLTPGSHTFYPLWHVYSGYTGTICQYVEQTMLLEEFN